VAKHHGKDGAVYLSTSAGGSLSLINLTAWTVDEVFDQIDCSDTNSENREYERGNLAVSGTLSGFWDSASDTLYDAATSEDEVSIILYPHRTTGRYWFGSVLIDFAITTGVDQAVAVNGSFVASESWDSARAGVGGVFGTARFGIDRFG
jgi:hypothetical protein